MLAIGERRSPVWRCLAADQTRPGAPLKASPNHQKRTAPMRPITDVLRDFRKGRLVDEATEQLAEIVRAATLHNKAGELTIKLKVKPTGHAEVELVAAVSCKVPRADMPKAIFYADAEGDLHRNDPQQSRMFADVEEEGASRSVSAMADPRRN
jgi:hypothetical protein